MLIVTGGAGFIGSNFQLTGAETDDEARVTLDALTYAGNIRNLESLLNDSRHTFVRGDIADSTLVTDLLTKNHPRAIVHFAAESHVDRSIQGPEAFVQTNVVGTHRLLEAARQYWESLAGNERAS